MGVGVKEVGLLLAVMQGVFSRTWVLTAPRRIVSIPNSCVTVPCHFEVPDNQEANILNCSNSANWRRGTHFNQKTAEAEIIGDLTKKNCTTVMRFSNIHNDLYFFRLECPEVKFSFVTGVNISIQTEPSPPQLSVVGQASEGGPARLQCEAPVSCSLLPPSLTWSPRDASSQEVSHIHQLSTDGSVIMTSTLTFMASADHHNQSILCSASYPLANGGSSSSPATSRRLSILYAPRFTTAAISPSGPVFEGETVMLTCSSDANPPVTRFTWFRDERGKIRAIAPGPTLDLQVSRSDSGAYLCQAQSPRGSQRSTSVFLEVGAAQAAGHSDGSVMMPYIVCGVVSVLYILTVLVDLYKYHSLSRRLKKIELKGEHTYTDLKTNRVNSDYDQLQLKPKSPPEVPEYENGVSMQVTV
ncbi:B-cell receptor CD22 [Platichthys flesus]|uniref:B-cell receptor CD22 n=1 Tax=Platichthys flesus TaxID=8260 RepID=UPI002DBCBFBB|nr:B-cell receptor CD22 [Platichthys flesus]